MKIVNFALLAFFSFFGFSLSAQISVGGVPPSFTELTNNNSSLRTVFPTIVLPALDMEKIHRQDSINDQKPAIPYRFGIAREVDFGLNNSGLWDTLTDGSRIWRIKIASPNAKSINLNYNVFYMPEGAEMYVYNSRKEILGAFTSLNNKEDSAFATMPISGDEITIEYYEPKNVLGQGRLHINQLVHGYRSFKRGGEKAFNSSGSCNVNINCPEGDRWQDEKRAVVSIMTNSNSSLCTGTLLNNVRQDETPYLLTAAHCGNISNSIFVFGYESPSCNPSINDSNTFSIVGGTLRSFFNNSSESDFQLLELSLTPPDSFDVFYVGWSAKNNIPVSSTVIHHPQGDVKKISKDYDPAKSTSYYNDPGPKNHWQINQWELGTTEGGSSGSALFNEFHQVVGQLHGGGASCGSKNPDWFGKFSYSWDNNPNASKQLKYWLDPDNTGIMEINGYDPDSAKFALDAEVLYLNGVPNYTCENNMQPSLILKNQGNDILTSIKIIYQTGGASSDSITWTGSLSYLETTEISLGNILLPNGKNQYTAFVQELNGQSDQNIGNDTIRSDFIFNNESEQVYLTLKTDDYGDETTWVLRDSASNDVLYKRGPFETITGGKVYKDTLCLYDSCFNFIIRDAVGDGFNSQFYGNGYYLFTNSFGDTLAFNDNFTSKLYNESFCVPNITGIHEMKDRKFQFRIYPNPISSNSFSFQSKIGIDNIKLYSVQGQFIKEWNIKSFSKNSLDLGVELPAGMYLFVAENRNGTFAQEKVVIH